MYYITYVLRFSHEPYVIYKLSSVDNNNYNLYIKVSRFDYLS